MRFFRPLEHLVRTIAATRAISERRVKKKENPTKIDRSPFGRLDSDDNHIDNSLGITGYGNIFVNHSRVSSAERNIITTKIKNLYFLIILL